MKAVLYDEPGDPDVLYLGDAPRPEPAKGELLIGVHASALNRADTFQRRGFYPPPDGASSILGLEAAGTVAEVGDEVSTFSLGDRVCALLSGGGYAEYVAVPANHVMRIPDGMSFEEAAAIPEVFLTAYQALYWLGGIQGARDILIHAGASGVGTAAIQLGREAGKQVHITASAPKHELCRELGATTTIDYKNEPIEERVQEATEGDGVQLIVDFVGAPYFNVNIESASMDATIVMLATLGGSELDDVDLRQWFKKRLTFTASTLRSRPDEYKRKLVQEFAAYGMPLFKDGNLQPVIDEVLSIENVASAHRKMEDNKNAGKLILNIK